MRRATSARVGPCCLLAAALVVGEGPARGGGFAVPEVGTRRTAMGAVVGRPDEPSAVYHNPAGLSLLPGTHLFVSLGVSLPDTDIRLAAWPGSAPYQTRFPVDGQGYYPPAVPTRAVGAIPMIVASTNVVSDALWAAVSLYVPNATGAAFADDSVVRYHLVDSYLVAGYAGLTVACRPLPWLTVAAGASLIHVRVHAVRRLFPVLGGTDYRFLLGDDASLSLDGEDTTAGWNAGLLLRPLPRLTIGASVIGRTDATLRGDVAISPGETSPFRAPFTGTQSTALLIPWTVMAGANVDVTRGIELGAELRYWVYSQLQSQHTDVEGIALLKALDAPKSYRDSWHLSGGARFHDDALGLEAMVGGHYDRTPAPDETVSLDSPSFNHSALHMGLRYAFGPPAAGGARRYRLGLSWEHIWYLERRTHGSLTQPPSNFAASGQNDIVTLSLEVALAARPVLARLRQPEPAR